MYSYGLNYKPHKKLGFAIMYLTYVPMLSFDVLFMVNITFSTVIWTFMVLILAKNCLFLYCKLLFKYVFVVIGIQIPKTWTL